MNFIDMQLCQKVLAPFLELKPPSAAPNDWRRPSTSSPGRGRPRPRRSGVRQSTFWAWWNDTERVIDSSSQAREANRPTHGSFVMRLFYWEANNETSARNADKIVEGVQPANAEAIQSCGDRLVGSMRPLCCRERGVSGLLPNIT
jgi:hypothetical protein